METITNHLTRSTVNDRNVVRAWEEDVLLPTYQIGEEEKNPIFLEKRVYQGSSGAVYPYAVVEKVSDEKKDKLYKAIFIENEYIKIMVLPELGGRIHMAFDKIKQRHFVYYNQVVKPALVGLTGPWISGGIEFNWPQHHRPSTFLPTDHYIENNSDGSITIWCNEVERLFRMKGMQGFTVYPDKAYIEIKVKVYNRTALPQTFLWWANPAVVVNDSYKSVFPPDVHAVFDHGKRDVSNFPIATGEYYKQDYSAGVDISKYKNIPVPTSYMAIKSKYDFVGGYQDDHQAGLLHVANHHVSPGKKQWTWGNGDFGLAWDRNLTDEDGPYIELMTGVYTDNQPDFSWIQPNEEKSWVQYFMPYSAVGYVKNATKDAVVNLEMIDGHAHIILYTTAEFADLGVKLSHVDGTVYLHESTSCSPRNTYHKEVRIGEEKIENLLLEVLSSEGTQLLKYQAEQPKIEPTPDPAKGAKDPKDISSIEQLFLTGQHLEQYRHATYNPIDYYTEALRREPHDIRCNNALGLLLLRRGQFEKAEKYFDEAIKTQTERNPNPYDGEPHYNLGLSLKFQKRFDDAYATFFKATWNAAWQDSGYFTLAQIDTRNKSWDVALENIDRALIKNWHNHKARQLKATILRKLNRTEDALQLISDSLAIDKFNIGCRFEKYLITNDINDLNELQQLLSQSIHTYIEYTLDYANAGLYAEAITFLQHGIEDENNVYPMVYYAIGYFYKQLADEVKAKAYYKKASAMSPERCFPNKLEEVTILIDAIQTHPEDSFAPYYLGNFWYANRQYDEARSSWEASIQLNGLFPTALRNLALAYYNKFDKKSEARELLEKAFSLDPTDSRIFMELDQLYKKLNLSHESRLALFDTYPELIEQRDDLLIEQITLYNQTGDYHSAKEMISNHIFHPWEGGEGKVTKQYTVCRVELAKQEIEKQNYREALQLLHEIDSYPHNLGEGKLANAEENDINYYKGVAYAGLGDQEQSLYFLHLATVGSQEPQQAFFYNDQQPDKIFYQGLAFKALGLEDKARSRFNKLIAHGKKHLFDTCRIDYFAVSLPDLAIWEDDLDVRNQIHCYYVIGLGELGLGNTAEGKKYLQKVLQLDINHIDCHLILKQYQSV
ncbi:DUF5107 domain-containing protein [Sphingobacterium olei]|uniref:DUF5107 domain-containing protein n=1 Tax=Sphingobacterium olei TaxID=2571155 RepID=A0A4V5MMI0_9SPHI|nr:DUF5107 domain-containing protein [Sphingobacterium olei]TJZ61038.1 DUF5107 domain-containing protein [Sphingobacterium olei]